ncbi:MAG: hypothetical protein KAR30_09890 [Gammaproteobacteria bacterium]|nr:hypothetical protein [Gammaproteobacteria bacterium]
MDIINRQSITKRILIPVILSLAAITGLAVVGAYWQKSQGFSQKANEQVAHINHLLETAIENDSQLMNALLDSIERNREIQQAWLDQDKDALLQTTKHLFQQIRSQYQITHFYFIGLDKVCFFRAHNPTHSGDLITRFTMQQASDTGTPTQGIELGTYGTFTLRVIRPWYIDGQLVGYIELGEESSNILDKLNHSNSTQLLVTIDKRFLDQKKWEAGQKILGHKDKWERFSDFTISQGYSHEEGNDNKAEITPDFERRLNTLQNASIDAHAEYLQYQLHAIPLLDTAKHRVGNIFTIHDNSENQEVLNTYVTIMVSIAVFITAIVSVFFFRYTTRIESGLNQSREMTEKAADEKIEALASANEFKTSFLANMSHEIRTPLNGISGMLQLLQITEPLTEEQKNFIEIAMSSEDLLMTLLNDLLDISKAEAGKLRLENINFDIIKLSNDVIAIFQPLAKQKGISLKNIISPEAPRFINSDPTRTRQILNNLISNAIKFTEQGEVKLEIKSIMPNENFHTLLFEVTDTGIGIDPDKKDLIFDSFTQADDSTTRQYGGTGLGLTITKHLINMMGGEIYVKSAPEEGTTFSFTIPMQETEQVYTERLGYMQNKDIRVLHVSHNIYHCQSISSILSEAGISNCFESVDNCVDKLLSAIGEDDPFHIVILDTMSLSKKEIKLAETIKENEALKDTHLILLVKTGIRGDASEARKSGFQGYLTSPMDSQQILKCINAIIGLPEVRQQNILVTKHFLDDLENNDSS